MDCNKDDAIMAKKIAEEMLINGDISGAKKIALKAQNLYPSLEGLSQFMLVIDVYTAHDKKINGQIDFYGIIGVDPLSSYEVVKKQYKRRALVLHPDKNTSIGADDAFKLFSQAWSVLSDKDQKCIYDAKLLNISTPAGPTPSNPTPHNHNQYSPFSNPQPGPTYQYTSATATGPQYTPAPRPSSHHNYTFATRNPLRYETFWTCCRRCRIQYKYPKIFLDHKLLCRSCRQPFFAKEIITPNVNVGDARPRDYSQQQQQQQEGVFGASSSFTGGASRTAEAPPGPSYFDSLKRKYDGQWQ